MSISGVEKDRRELRIHENAAELSSNLAEYIAELSEAAVKERGVFAVALSGGSLITLMGKLCEAPYIKTVDWAKWYIFWADERVVAKNHADSNYKLAKDGLFSKEEPYPGLPVVASLFPNHFVLNEKDQWVTFITDSPKPPPERITFTFPVINSASNVAVVVTGSSKAEAAHLAIDDIGPDSPQLPARMVQPIKGKLVWFLDAEAASRLDGIKASE
ncbi:6-phosphogluconolactonase - like protein [Handroanthus impetiginosus]|uniref:6-phosphogluconolactonase-like protein n=1 Tax=Handroanthus impetiginosus TaxID=429701 RepID=A0A2G9GE13_9LAMI|nr:6-phosphogluconolactonase - like protein [Handroanthus impetiginosus]